MSEAAQLRASLKDLQRQLVRMQRQATTASDNEAGDGCCEPWRSGFQYRRKPKTITINGIEVPAPLDREPKKGDTYYTITLAGVLYGTWSNREEDKERFAFGIWATKEDAEKVCAAIMKALKP